MLYSGGLIGALGFGRGRGPWNFGAIAAKCLPLQLLYGFQAVSAWQRPRAGFSGQILQLWVGFHKKLFMCIAVVEHMANLVTPARGKVTSLVLQ